MGKSWSRIESCCWGEGEEGGRGEGEKGGWGEREEGGRGVCRVGEDLGGVEKSGWGIEKG